MIELKNNMLLYHASYTRIENIDLSKGSAVFGICKE